MAGDGEISDPYEKAEYRIERARSTETRGKGKAGRTASVESLAALTEALFAVATAIEVGTTRIADALLAVEDPGVAKAIEEGATRVAEALAMVQEPAR
jgi:hypothetical protein